MITLRLRKLIDGYKVDKKYLGKNLIAFKVDYMEEEVQANWNNEKMIIKPNTKPLKYGDEIYQDKFGRGSYKLVYYEWKPELSQTKIF